MENKQAPAPKTIETQAKQNAVRNDPVQRYADGADYGTGLKGSNPDRKYVLVYKGDSAMGVEYYEELGYTIERYREGGPTFFAAKTGQTGDVMEYRGHVLMSISKEDHAALRKFGGPGAGKGSDHWTKMEAALLAKGQGQPDHLRGIDGRKFMHVVNRSEVSEEKGRI
jgi:hypothetical protein